MLELLKILNSDLINMQDPNILLGMQYVSMAKNI